MLINRVLWVVRLGSWVFGALCFEGLFHLPAILKCSSPSISKYRKSTLKYNTKALLILCL